MNAKDRFVRSRFKDQTACVLGLGKSGLAAANMLASKGFSVLVSEARPRAQLAEELRRLHYHVQLEAGGHGPKALKCGFIVKSPGIPQHAPILEQARAKGIPVFSELEVALAFAPTDRIYAITGTNGKTTTTRLLGDILKASGLRVHVGGNIGAPLSGLVSEMTVGDSLVLEVSSYQLEDSRWFHPKAACLLNITPDHVEHHGTHAAYVAAKARVFAGQKAGDLCVFNAADPQVAALAKTAKGGRLYFALAEKPGLNAWKEKGFLRFRLPGRTHRLLPPNLPGDHNLENAMAAGLMALGCGTPVDAVTRAFAAFKGVEHRIEACGAVRGIACYNDSKATNVDSTLVALRSFGKSKKNLLLILGGLDKGAPYAPLRGEIEKKVRAVYTIGSAAAKIEKELDGAAPMVRCGTLAKAVDKALEQGKAGDVLLLSPACASFDQFKDFEDRGRQFKQLIDDKRRAEASLASA